MVAFDVAAHEPGIGFNGSQSEIGRVVGIE